MSGERRVTCRRGHPRAGTTARGSRGRLGGMRWRPLVIWLSSPLPSTYYVSSRPCHTLCSHSLDTQHRCERLIGTACCWTAAPAGCPSRRQPRPAVRCMSSSPGGVWLIARKLSAVARARAGPFSRTRGACHATTSRAYKYDYNGDGMPVGRGRGRGRGRGSRPAAAQLSRLPTMHTVHILLTALLNPVASAPCPRAHCCQLPRRNTARGRLRDRKSGV